jgi:hypothetical protein
MGLTTFVLGVSFWRIIRGLKSTRKFIKIGDDKLPFYVMIAPHGPLLYRITTFVPNKKNPNAEPRAYEASVDINGNRTVVDMQAVIKVRIVNE